MSKVKITADAVLAIVRGIFEDEDINVVIDTVSAPEEWQGKTVTDVLNTEYYTFKHRPSDTKKKFEELIEAERSAERLGALARSFCLLSLGETERLYSKDTDMAAVTASLEYYLQTDKVKLLEYLIEAANIATSGLRIPVQFGDELRKAVIFFGRPIVGDIVSATSYGEAAIVDIEVSVMFYPDVVSYSEYTISVTFTDSDGESKTVSVPLTNFSAANTMTQESMPHMDNERDTGSINLSRANTFVLTFEGYTNDFIDYITDKALCPPDDNGDNNEAYTLTIQRGTKTYEHVVVVKDHRISANADTGNETHTLSLVKRGIID